MEYLDFELEIGAGTGRDYPMSIVRSPAGEVHETMHFPFDELALENHLLNLQNALLRSGGRYRQALSPEEHTVQSFGQALFNTLLSGDVRRYYEVSQHEANHQGKGLRLKLRIHDPALAALPWEFLYDPEQGEYVCLSSNTPIVRYIELPQPPQPLTVTPPLSILGVAASPKDLPSLDIAREKQRIEEALKDLQAKNLVRLTWLQDNTWQSLQRAMRGGPWHIFHFVGHGDFNAAIDEGLIALEDEEGKAHFLRASHLARLLNGHHPLRLVVLNSCEGARGSKQDIFSSTAAILVRRGIPAVLAMQYEITDRAAIELSRAFYESLADGVPVDMAVCEARKAISLGVTNTLEWGTPVLYMRSPNGVLFDLVREPAKQAPRSEPTPAAQAPAAKLPPASIQYPLPARPPALPPQDRYVIFVPAGSMPQTVPATTAAPSVKQGAPLKSPVPVPPPQTMPYVIPKPAGHVMPPIPPPARPQEGVSPARRGYHMGKRPLLIGLVLLLLVAALVTGGILVGNSIGSQVSQPPPTSGPTSPPGEVPGEVPAVIEQFYNNLNGWNYTAAYALYGRDFHNATAYPNFVDDFQHTLSQKFQVTNTSPMEGNVYRVQVTINAIEKLPNPSGVVRTTYTRYHDVGLEDSTWKILDEKTSRENRVSIPDPSLTLTPGATPSENAESIIQQFSSYINEHKYSYAYNLWGADLQKQTVYHDFVETYARVEQIAITSKNIEVLSDGKIQIDVEVNTTEQTSSGPQTSTSQERYTVGQEYNQWKILDMTRL